MNGEAGEKYWSCFQWRILWGLANVPSWWRASINFLKKINWHKTRDRLLRKSTDPVLALRQSIDTGTDVFINIKIRFAFQSKIFWSFLNTMLVFHFDVKIWKQQHNQRAEDLLIIYIAQRYWQIKAPELSLRQPLWCQNNCFRMIL